MSEAFIQSNVRDYVFPLCTGQIIEGEIIFKNFLGSGFLIGKNSFALTAAHVVDKVDDYIFAMFIDHKSEWKCFKITKLENHPQEDIALIKINEVKLKSIFCFNNAFETSSRDYIQFAYPDDMMYELEEWGKASGRPDMICLKGYIRRRTNHRITKLRGNSFFELNQIGGTGCSGSPIFKIDSMKIWRVMGVYVGEIINDRGTSVAYAVREDAIRDWAPHSLGHSLLIEAGID